MRKVAGEKTASAAKVAGENTGNGGTTETRFKLCAAVGVFTNSKRRNILFFADLCMEWQNRCYMLQYVREYLMKPGIIQLKAECAGMVPATIVLTSKGAVTNPSKNLRSE